MMNMILIQRNILNAPQPIRSLSQNAAFEQMENVLRKNGQIVYGKLGKALCQLMKASDVINATLDILKNGINDNLN